MDDAVEDRLVLTAALRRLPARQRETVVLRYYLGCSEARAAELMGISTGSVKTHLSRAVTALARDKEALR